MLFFFYLVLLNSQNENPDHRNFHEDNKFSSHLTLGPLLVHYIMERGSVSVCPLKTLIFYVVETIFLYKYRKYLNMVRIILFLKVSQEKTFSRFSRKIPATFDFFEIDILVPPSESKIAFTL